MLKLREALRLNHPPVVLGVFHNTDELFRACAVLTDFGYPKESARMARVETIMPTPAGGTFGSVLRHITPTKIFIALATMAVVTIGAVVLAEIPLSAYGRLPEFLVTLVLWALFFSAGSLACALIGFLLWSLLQPLLTNHANLRGGSLANFTKGKVTLRIKARTPVDAKEIAEAWTEIGGRVIESGKPAASTVL